MNTPTITSLVLRNEPSSPHMPKPPWHNPFLKVLSLLKITEPKPEPKVDDQRFCFQPSHDFSEISKIFLSVSTSDLQYDIDLKSIRLVGSDVVPPAVTELQEYANNVLQRTRQLRDCLLQRSVINDPACFLHVDMLTCPICSDPLVGCFECDAKVACSNPLCRASDVNCEQCFAHHRMTCHECLKASDTVPPLICCPMCQAWCCREDASWCPGLVIQPTLGSEKLAELSRGCEWDSKTIVRSHPPRPSRCRLCTDYDFPQDWATCANRTNDTTSDCCPSQTPFMTDSHLCGSHCPDCLEQSPGRRCVCGVTWLCAICAAIANKSVDYPYLITCPRCGADFCTPRPSSPCAGPIDFCRTCKGVILCNDCEEEEELPGDVQTAPDLPKQVVFTEQCGFCMVWSCGDCCASDDTARCFHCGRWFCHGCVIDCDVTRPCSFCSGPSCKDCREEGCAGITALWDTMPPRPRNIRGPFLGHDGS